MRSCFEWSFGEVSCRTGVDLYHGKIEGRCAKFVVGVVQNVQKRTGKKAGSQNVSPEAMFARGRK